MLTGSNLFLANSIASTPDFGNPTEVPPEFTGTQLIVPHPAAGVLYLKLRDDPATVQTLTLPVVPITLPAEAAAIKSQPGTTPAPASLQSTPPPDATAPAPAAPPAGISKQPQQSTTPSTTPVPATAQPHASAAPASDPSSNTPAETARPADHAQTAPQPAPVKQDATKSSQ
jgi:hypothetical protein